MPANINETEPHQRALRHFQLQSCQEKKIDPKLLDNKNEKPMGDEKH